MQRTGLGSGPFVTTLSLIGRWVSSVYTRSASPCLKYLGALGQTRALKAIRAIRGADPSSPPYFILLPVPQRGLPRDEVLRVSALQSQMPVKIGPGLFLSDARSVKNVSFFLGVYGYQFTSLCRQINSRVKSIDCWLCWRRLHGSLLHFVFLHFIHL